MPRSKFIKKQLKYFFFFYSFLKGRAFIIIFLSFIIGGLDGIGLAFFIPLLQMAFNREAYEITKNETFLQEFIFNNFNFEPTLFNVFIIILILFSLKGVIKFFDSYLKVFWQEKITREIKLNNIALFKNLKYSGFLKIDIGKIQNTLTNEVIKISLAYKFYFKTLNFIILVFTYFLFSLKVDWRFTIIVLSGGIAISIFFKLLYKRTEKLSKKLVEEAHHYHKLLSEKVNLYKYLKSTGLLEKYINKMNKNTLIIEKTQKKLGLVESAVYGFKEPLVIIIIFMAILLYNQYFANTISNLMLNLLFIYRAFIFFMASQENWNLFLGYSGSIENLEYFENELKTEQEEKETKKKIVHKFKQQLLLKNVSFKYDTNKDYILKNISFEIKKNKSIAIVGPSGSGKTTLLNILTGLLSPSTGKVYFDEYELNNVAISSYRKLIGYIIQDSPIFNDTIYNNISFWDQKNSTNYTKFTEAIRESNIKEFVLDLPEKENALLGSNGINLSGGQKQRISIARELYKSPEILFMDEATSNLDTKTEAEIQKNIEKLKGNYTIITIAHRLATIKNADTIILLEQGQITGKGTYKDLIETSSSFRRMVELQSLQ